MLSVMLVSEEKLLEWINSHWITKNKEYRSCLAPRLATRFWVAVNFPEAKTLGSMPAKATNFFG